MLVVARCHPASSIGQPLRFGLAASVIAVALAGCSADITRFDSPSFAFNDSGGSNIASGSVGNASGGPVADVRPMVPPPQTTYLAPPPASTRGDAVAALPAGNRQTVPVEVLPAIEKPPSAAPAAYRPTAPAAYRPAAPVVPPALERGASIEVQRGDTVFGIARRHNIAVSELMSSNNLTNPNIWPGQKLYLPAGIKPVAGAAPAVPAQPQPLREAASAPPDWYGSYTVRPGDSLYAIARRFHVNAAALQRANGIADARRLKPGVELKVPGGQSIAAAPAVHRPASVPSPIASRYAGERSATPASEPSFRSPETMSNVTVLNGPAAKPTVPVQPAAYANAGSSKGASATKLRWPVSGRIVEGFGRRADGSHNDGINLAVPQGTDVLAAEDGVVAYAGSEVKTYGNLVLIRHDNGLVTAYAYNDRLLVSRGDRVKRGQPIAKAGSSGVVDQPQLHFEVRVGAKPVDPLTHLEKL
ncbi:MAG: LysM peptidoglycan-binding domain-containing protein [Hyphomicrobiaceae bacterium]